MELQVRCPKCKWEPGEQAEWSCTNCGYEWHLFDTAGRCPRCNEQNEDVYCIEWLGGCGEASLYLDWYEGLDDKLSEINIKKSFD